MCMAHAQKITGKNSQKTVQIMIKNNPQFNRHDQKDHKYSGILKFERLIIKILIQGLIFKCKSPGGIHVKKCLNLFTKLIIYLITYFLSFFSYKIIFFCMHILSLAHFFSLYFIFFLIS